MSSTPVHVARWLRTFRGVSASGAAECECEEVCETFRQSIQCCSQEYGKHAPLESCSPSWATKCDGGFDWAH
jgi:hypothetical protein